MRFCAVACLVALASPAGAETFVRAQDPQTVVAAMQGAGFTAKIGTDKGGDPMITSGYSGTAFRVFFYNCTKNRDCATVQFHTGYDLDKPVTLEQINEWNRTQRFARAFLDKDNDPIVEMDIDLDDGGVSNALFLDNLEFWTSSLGEFERHIGFRK
jgi:Putative bacterial sensory transduction regulator